VGRGEVENGSPQFPNAGPGNWSLGAELTYRKSVRGEPKKKEKRHPLGEKLGGSRRCQRDSGTLIGTSTSYSCSPGEVGLGLV